MLVTRHNGFAGLGDPTASGYCLINGTWFWVTQDKCAQPVQPGGAPVVQAGFCWTRQNPPNAFPGFWGRMQAGQTSCPYEGPPAAPDGSGGVIVRTEADRVNVKDALTRRTVYAKAVEHAQRLEARRHDVIVGLYATGQLKTCAEAMYPGALAAERRAGVFCREEFTKGNLKILDPIGVVVELGVPFAPDELGAGLLERVYTPTEDQRFQADLLIYATSQRQLARTFAPGADIPESADLPTNLTKRLETLALFASNDTSTIFMREVATSRLSVQQLLDRRPFVLSLPGFTFNPVQPTADELNKEGGLLAYYKRGGFVISTDVVNGVVPAGRASMTWNTGYCTCGEGGTPMATFGRATGEGYGWDITLKVAGDQYTMRVTPHDAPLWSEAATFVAGKLKDLAKFICSNREVIQTVNNDILIKEICTGADGKPCVKGTKDCSCTKPTTGQQAAVGAGMAVLGKWCSAVQTWDKPKETPFTPPPPPSDSRVKWTTIVLGVLGGLTAGGVAAHRLSKPR